MARLVPPLSDYKCDAARPQDKDYKLLDGQGLFLLVKVNGAKTWHFKFSRPDGREGLATFGSYPTVPRPDQGCTVSVSRVRGAVQTPECDH